RVRERLAIPDLVCIGTSATMASEGSQHDRDRKVAEVASRLFATDIPHTNVVSETLVRITDPAENAQTVVPRLAQAMTDGTESDASDADLAAHPLAIWVENTLGLAREAGSRLVRARPRTLEEAIDALTAASGVERGAAEEALRNLLLVAARP